MSCSTNVQFNSKTIRIEDPIDESKTVFMYYDKTGDSLRVFHLNPDTNIVPSFTEFNFDLSNKVEFYAGESMTSIQINFDGTIGSSSTITSQNGIISGVSPFQTNNFNFNFYC